MKKQSDIRIIVAGTSGKGKSTILQIIAEALANHGLSLEVRNMPGEVDSPIAITNWQNQRIMALRGKRPHIVLEERHTYTSILKDDPTKIFGVSEPTIKGNKSRSSKR